jgi:phage-related protein
MELPDLKPLGWVGASKRELLAMPDEVQDAIGYVLYLAQTGDRHPSMKPLKGFGGAGVIELVEDHHGGTYRAVYTVRFRDIIYVLHAFQKKSTKGIETPRHTIELIHERLAQAEMLHAERMKRRSS